MCYIPSDMERYEIENLRSEEEDDEICFTNILRT